MCVRVLKDLKSARMFAYSVYRLTGMLDFNSA